MNVLLGVSGGIAAYKSAALTRLFVSAGHSVKVVMTPCARDFITPLTMATLSGNPVYVENFSPENGAWNSHISLGSWADIFVIAPATANTIASMAGGIANNLLLTTYLSARCGVVIAPAMDLDMYAHPTTTRNIEYLKSVGVAVVEPTEGFLASGLTGKGRMAEPEAIFNFIVNSKEKDFAGKRVMITAGATLEKIDPVRYISNFSTGAMGRAIAAEFEARGAEVTLIAGAMSAEQMYQQACSAFSNCDIAVFAAAVADYTPKKPANLKIKHQGVSEIAIELKATKDIAGELSSKKRPGQITVGFALETDNEIENALKKLKDKNLDAIVLNSLQDAGAGFGGNTNKITILDTKGQTNFCLKSKAEVAADIVNYIQNQLIH